MRTLFGASLTLMVLKYCNCQLDNNAFYYFDENNNGTCEINACFWLGSAKLCHGYAIEDNELSYSWMIRSSIVCNELSSIGCDYNDLVFDDINNCLSYSTCRAACSCDESEEGNTEYYLYQDETKKQCYKCTCESFNTNGDLAWNCDEDDEAYSTELEYDLFSCPDESVVKLLKFNNCLYQILYCHTSHNIIIFVIYFISIANNDTM